MNPAEKQMLESMKELGFTPVRDYDKGYKILNDDGKTVTNYNFILRDYPDPYYYNIFRVSEEEANKIAKIINTYKRNRDKNDWKNVWRFDGFTYVFGHARVCIF